MYISDINFYKKQGIAYIVISIATLIFSLIYEMFSHNVTSFFMLYAFLIPLVFGAIISVILYVIKVSRLTRMQINLYNAGIATLTVGSIIKGVLEIYGTTNWKVYIYPFLGILLILCSLKTSKLGKI